MDVDAYLRRIGYDGPRGPTLSTLRRLHVAHLQTVPFENLDIGLRRPISLDPAAMFHKIVERRRGGYCYELNGLFALFLRELGFRVDMLSAGVVRRDGRSSPEFDHMALRVHLEEPWLADVGFGELFVEPLRLNLDGIQVERGRSFRIDREGERRVLWMDNDDRAWTPQYRFTATPHRLDEFEDRNRWQQTARESHFTQNTICSRVTPGGRITLSGSRLIVTRGRMREERPLTEGEHTAVLKDTFGIEL
jgi:N-hydroxyarylamine O-acetyltransferase